MLLLLSSLFGATGGIPAFNRLLVRAAAEYVATAGPAPLRVVALTDETSQTPPDAFVGALPAEAQARLPPDWYTPCGGDRLAFAKMGWQRRRDGDRLLLGHVNLAPLGALLSRRYGVIAHGTEVWSPLPLHRRLALRRATAIGCVSEHTSRQVATVQGCAASRCVRIINALETLPAQLPLDGPSDRPLQLLSVTRLYPGEPKGIDLVLRALAELPPIPLLRDARYVVVGDGPGRAALVELRDQLGLRERVDFVGQVGDEERDRLLADCDIFVLPSSNEGFGIVYLEAMAYAKPCLAARVGGAPEVVLDDETGLVVQPAVALVASALHRLSEAPLRQRLGRAGRKRLESHFTYPEFRRHAFALFAQL